MSRRRLLLVLEVGEAVQVEVAAALLSSVVMLAMATQERVKGLNLERVRAEWRKGHCQKRPCRSVENQTLIE